VLARALSNQLRHCDALLRSYPTAARAAQRLHSDDGTIRAELGDQRRQVDGKDLAVDEAIAHETKAVLAQPAEGVEAPMDCSPPLHSTT